MMISANIDIFIGENNTTELNNLLKNIFIVKTTMKILLVIAQFYFYCFWMISNFILKFIFPIQNSFDNMFPTKIKINIANLYIIDTVYQKKIVCPKDLKLKNLVKHPSYHPNSFIYIEYSIYNVGKLNGNYVIILKGGDRDSLIRTITYLENVDSFKEYINLDEFQDNIIDGQFNITNQNVEVDKTTFVNKLLGIDRSGHKFLYLHHELMKISDYWKLLCIMDGTMHWLHENVNLTTVDMNLNEKKFLYEENLFNTQITNYAHQVE